MASMYLLVAVQPRPWHAIMCSQMDATGILHAADAQMRRTHNPLRAARLAAGLTQEQLARKAGVGERAISAIERGRECPRRHTRRVILKALGIPQSQHRRMFGPLPVCGTRAP